MSSPAPGQARPQPARPADRYGDRTGAGRRTLWVVLTVAALAVAVGFAGWVGIAAARSPVSWSDAGVEVLDDAHTDVSYTVTARPGLAVVCTVQALNSGQAVVGLIDVRIGPSTQGTVTVTTRVPTTERAAGGEVKACAAA